VRTILIYAAAALISFTLGSVSGCKGEDPAAAPETTAPGTTAAAEGKTVKTKSGLKITEIRAGTGKQPRRNSTVKIHYHGTLKSGMVFDSSLKRGKPATFPLARLIPCWREGIPMMREGGKSRLVCPPHLAYGKRGKPPKIPGNATLTFEIKLIKVVK
jgi:FKBP-type peptidyl-prolyl cis-trans isomerase